ncbi:hypothetical protein GCM10027347_61510 [Larkinella harenae]
MDKEPKQVQVLVRMSPKMKSDLLAIAKEKEVSISDYIRDLVSNSVRSYRRQNGKTA